MAKRGMRRAVALEMRIREAAAKNKPESAIERIGTLAAETEALVESPEKYLLLQRLGKLVDETVALVADKPKGKK